MGGFWCDVLKRASLRFVVVRGGEKAGGVVMEVFIVNVLLGGGW